MMNRAFATFLTILCLLSALFQIPAIGSTRLSSHGVNDLASDTDDSACVLWHGNHWFHLDADIPIVKKTRGVIAGDVVGDGQTRIIAGSWDTGYVHVLKYDGWNFVEEWRDLVIADGEIIPSAVGDVNNDGKPELLVAHHLGNIYMYKWNGATLELVLMQNLGGDFMPAAIADLDRDGQNELLIETGYYYTGELSIYEYSSATNEFDLIWSGPSEGGPHEISVGDVDGDGEAEAVYVPWLDDPWSPGNLVVVGYNGSEYVIEANITAFPYELGGVSTGDLDGDGIEEIVTATYNVDAPEFPIFVVEYDQGEYQVKNVHTGTCGMFQIHIGDVDGDGAVEASILRNSRGSFLLEYHKRGYQVVEVDHDGACIFGDVADVDGDGRDEIVAGSVSGTKVVSDISRFTGHDVGITRIVPSRRVIGQGHSLPIDVTIVNYGTNLETPTIVVNCNETMIYTQEITITSRNCTTLSLMWNTTDFLFGNYTLMAEAGTVPAETDITDNTLMNDWVVVTILTDLDGNWKVNIIDISIVAMAFGTQEGDEHYNVLADLDENNEVNILDISTVALDYGKTVQ